jgi:hypothetical protein
MGAIWQGERLDLDAMDFSNIIGAIRRSHLSGSIKGRLHMQRCLLKDVIIAVLGLKDA